VQQQAAVCTKRSNKENVAFLKQPHVWPAYHGWGGSFELDTLKLIDLLNCRDNSTGQCPMTTVDFVLDLGANTGYYTEKLTARHFAKNYLLIEGNAFTGNVLKERWMNETWKSRWFSEQVPKRSGGNPPAPQFQVLSRALSNQSGEIINMCETEASFAYNPAGCNVPMMTVDDIIMKELTPAFKRSMAEAHSVFIKIDTEGMDGLVMQGMSQLLQEIRGQYPDGSPRYLVNFLQFEFSPFLLKIAEKRTKTVYNIQTVAKFLESLGFESFIIGPRYLPISHGSWDDEYFTFTNDPENNAGVRTTYPEFGGTLCSWCQDSAEPTFTGDVFVMRSSHPRATEIKVALGVCEESSDFHVSDPQYRF